jgi:hypothetical protein
VGVTWKSNEVTEESTDFLFRNTYAGVAYFYEELSHLIWIHRRGIRIANLAVFDAGLFKPGGDGDFSLLGELY